MFTFGFALLVGISYYAGNSNRVCPDPEPASDRPFLASNAIVLAARLRPDSMLAFLLDRFRFICSFKRRRECRFGRPSDGSPATPGKR